MTTERIFLPYQARWYALGRKSGRRWRIGEKARQIGLTWTEACRQTSIASSAKTAGGRRCLYVSTSLLLAREYVETVATWARAQHGAATHQGLTLLRDGADDILAHEVRFASGFSVTGVSSNPAAFRGRRGEVCIDEAAHHVRLDEIIKAAFAVTQWGGTVTVISTHNGARNPFVKLIEQVRGGEVSGHHMRLPLDLALADGLYRRICKVSGRIWTAEAEAEFRSDCLASPGADEEFNCLPSEAGSVFYRKELLEACARGGEVVHLERPKEWALKNQADRERDTLEWCKKRLEPLLSANKVINRDRVHYLGADYGRRVDLSVLWILEQANNLTQTSPLMIELRNVPLREQELIADYVIGKLPRCGGVAVDVSEGGGHGLAEGLAGRWRWREPGTGGPGLIVGVKLGPAWYDREHFRLRARLEERDLVIVRDEDVLADLGSWRVGENGAVRLGERTISSRDKGQRHGDAGVALLLAQSLAPEVPQSNKAPELRPLVGGAGKRSRAWP